MLIFPKMEFEFDKKNILRGFCLPRLKHCFEHTINVFTATLSNNRKVNQINWPIL